jgi:hypothetical protein
VAVEHDARDERPGSRSESEDPYVSVSLGAGYLRMTAAVAARLRDTVEETAGGAEWLAAPMSQALSLLALGARSPANDDDVARCGTPHGTTPPGGRMSRLAGKLYELLDC